MNDRVKGGIHATLKTLLPLPVHGGPSRRRCASDLSILLESYYRLHPEFRDHTQVTLFLDEIQLVPGWETFARRILDSEKARRLVSGSSATMLSQRAENESQFKRWFPFFQTDVDLT